MHPQDHPHQLPLIPDAMGEIERARTRGTLIAGVDEAGVGALAGDLFAAAVVFGDRPVPLGVADSKTLSPAMRERLSVAIMQQALFWSVGRSRACEIDALNVLQADMRAMARALRALGVHPGLIAIDGLHAPPGVSGVLCICGGDRRVPEIAAASILAKVFRDRAMLRRDRDYPAYGFARHKGYGTAQHLRALRLYGPCRIHRMSFAPVREAARTSPQR